MKNQPVHIPAGTRRVNGTRRRHEESLSTSSWLTTVFRQMYQPMAAKVTAKLVAVPPPSLFLEAVQANLKRRLGQTAKEEA